MSALHSEVAVALRGSALESSVGADPWVPTRVPLGGPSLRRAHAGGALLLGYDHTSSAQAGRSRHALTGGCRPDLIVAWRGGDGEGAWVVLDAKYRVHRGSITEAFASSRGYRDALLLKGHGGRPRARLLLVPEVGSDCAKQLRVHDPGRLSGLSASAARRGGRSAGSPGC